MILYFILKMFLNLGKPTINNSFQLCSRRIEYYKLDHNKRYLKKYMSICRNTVKMFNWCPCISKVK